MRHACFATAFLLAASTALPLAAQGVVVSGSSSAQYVELRPLVLDSVPYAFTDSAYGAYRRTPAGILATCAASVGYCTFFRSAQTQALTAMMQDIDVSAWGLGEGVSVHAQLRARTAVGAGRDIWPQATQHFDALAAYVDVDRDLGRARLGRQWITSTLGVFNFDGLGLTLHPTRAFSTEVYGGQSLIEGLNKPLAPDVLAPVEDLPPTDHAYLVGGTLQLRPSPIGALRVQYQREIRADRGATYSERLGATGDWLIASATLSGQLTRDIAAGQFNDLAATLRMPLSAGMSGSLTARHYAPYFDLWTIWGAFSPVAFNEYGGELRWGLFSNRLTVHGSGGWRSYNDTQTGVASLPLRRDGWHAGGQASWWPSLTTSIDASYSADIGFGASGSNTDIAWRWHPNDGLSLAIRGTAFQTIDEFQVGEGRVFGGGGEATWQLNPALRFVGDIALYRHTVRDQPQLLDWNQRRANVRLEWSLGGPSWGGAIGKARREAP